MIHPYRHRGRKVKKKKKNKACSKLIEIYFQHLNEKKFYACIRRYFQVKNNLSLAHLIKWSSFGGRLRIFWHGESENERERMNLPFCFLSNILQYHHHMKLNENSIYAIHEEKSWKMRKKSLGKFPRFHSQSRYFLSLLPSFLSLFSQFLFIRDIS